jgi:adenosine kinase
VSDEALILVSGSLAFDQILLYDGRIRDHLPSDEESSMYLNLRARGPVRSRGGCGGNVAYTLSLFEVPVRIAAYIGTDGLEYLDYLRNLHVDTKDVIVDDEFITPSGILLVDSQGDQILFFGESEYPRSFTLPSMENVSLTVVTAGIPAYSVAVMRRSRESGIPFIVDPGKFIMDIEPGLLLKGMEGADSLILNEYELGLLMRRTGLSRDEVLSKSGCLITTYGSEGVSVETERGREKVSAAPVEEVVDPNGAGDAFLAGYAYGRFRGLPPVESARIGAVAASFAIESKGAQSHSFTSGTFDERIAESHDV